MIKTTKQFTRGIGRLHYTLSRTAEQSIAKNLNEIRKNLLPKILQI